jgi:hypothetical protein
MCVHRANLSFTFCIEQNSGMSRAPCGVFVMETTAYFPATNPVAVFLL